VQWFERARFELHPENPPPFNVLFGLLGNEIRDNAGPPPPPPPPPAPKPLPPPSFNNCQEDPTRDQAPNYPVQIVAINKGAETVTLKNVSPDPVSLDGWRMCSIKGNQLHEGIGGVLAPGEAKEFGHPGGQIWNNSEEDDGALYNAEGQLVSYRDA
jgi:micrococcal nuclease